MGAWNHSLVGSDHVQDALMTAEEMDERAARREHKQNEGQDADDVESERIEEFVGYFYQKVLDGEITRENCSKDLKESFFFFLKELQTAKFIFRWENEEERYSEIKKAKKEIEEKGFDCVLHF